MKNDGYFAARVVLTAAHCLENVRQALVTIECIDACKSTRLSGCPVVPSLDLCMQFCSRSANS